MNKLIRLFAAAAVAMSSVACLLSQTSYVLVSVKSNKVLHVSGDSKNAGVYIDQWDYKGALSQQWLLSSVGGDVYYIKNANSGLALEVKYDLTSDGARVDQWSYAGAASQLWKLSAVGGGAYTITNVNSGKVLEVMYDSINNGAAIDQWPNWGQTSQQWLLVPVGQGTPECSSVTASTDSVTGDSYELYANNVQNAVCVWFPTWSEALGQNNDIVWHQGVFSPANNRWQCTVKRSDHHNATGSYKTDVWSLGADNQMHGLGEIFVDVYGVQNAVPSCLSISSSTNPVTTHTYEVYAVVQNAIRVRFPTWREGYGAVWYEGTFDSASNRWKCSVNLADFGYGSGNYYTDIYATGAGNQEYNLGRFSVPVSIPTGWINIAASCSVAPNKGSITCSINDSVVGQAVSVTYPVKDSMHDIITMGVGGPGYVAWQVEENVTGYSTYETLYIAIYNRLSRSWSMSEIKTIHSGSWSDSAAYFIVPSTFACTLNSGSFAWGWNVQAWSGMSSGSIFMLTGEYVIPAQVLQ